MFPVEVSSVRNFKVSPVSDILRVNSVHNFSAKFFHTRVLSELFYLLEGEQLTAVHRESTPRALHEASSNLTQFCHQWDY